MSRRLLGMVSLVGCLVLQVAAAPDAVAKRTYVYLHDSNAGAAVWAFAMDKRGTLTPVPGSPFAIVDEPGSCGGSCQTMAYSSKRKVLVTSGPTGVTSWIVAKDGSLSPVAGSPFSSGNGNDYLGTAVVQAGKRAFAYSASFVTDEAQGFEIMKDGTLEALPGAGPTGVGPVGMEARKRLLFVADQDSLSVSSFVVGKDGSLTPAPGSPLALPGATFVFNVNPDPKGKRLYVYDEGDDIGGQIYGFAVDKRSAALSPIAGSPFRTFPVGAKTGLAVAKKLLLAFDYEDPTNDIQPFRIGKQGVLTETGTIISSGRLLDVHWIDPKGKRLIVAGPTSIETAKLAKDGLPTTTGEVILPGLAPTAVVVVKR